MDSCLAVERELDKVLSKFGNLKDNSGRTLEELIQFVQDLQRELEAYESETLSATNSGRVIQCVKKVRDTVAKIATEHRDLHSTVSKVGKAIDRNFVADFGSTGIDDSFETPDKMKLLNQVICEHFCRQGMLEIAEELLKEARVEVSHTKKEPFFELNRISEALKQKDLQPALNWAKANHERLQSQSSTIEFKLHRLQFIDLISRGTAYQAEAVKYARENFPKFAHTHENEIQVLMGSLLYLKHGILNSPYSYLLNSIHWAEISDHFTRDACALLGLSIESPLAVCINAGCTALPALLNIKQVMLQRQVTGVWTSRDELPIEIDLGKENRYHSIFACPILRQQSSETNPPMRLTCGHVVSRDALNKLVSGTKLKCPYCPMEQSPADAQMVHF
ncbi:E3 ubiquitin-protein transferase rmnd5a [Chamberlinius hualienensis]